MSDFHKKDTLVLLQEATPIIDAIRQNKIESIETDLQTEDFYNIRDCVSLSDKTLDAVNTFNAKIKTPNLVTMWSFNGFDIESFWQFLESKSTRDLSNDSEREWCTHSIFLTTIEHLYKDYNAYFNSRGKIYTFEELLEININELTEKMYNKEILFLNNDFYNFANNLCMNEEGLTLLIEKEIKNMSVCKKVECF